MFTDIPESIVCEETFGIRTCIVCKEPRPLDYFYKKPDPKGRWRCKECTRSINLKSYYKHWEKRQEYNKNYAKKNGEKIRARSRAWYRNNTERAKLSMKRRSERKKKEV